MLLMAWAPLTHLYPWPQSRFLCACMVPRLLLPGPSLAVMSDYGDGFGLGGSLGGFRYGGFGSSDCTHTKPADADGSSRLPTRRHLTGLSLVDMNMGTEAKPADADGGSRLPTRRHLTGLSLVDMDITRTSPGSFKRINTNESRLDREPVGAPNKAKVNAKTTKKRAANKTDSGSHAANMSAVKPGQRPTQRAGWRTAEVQRKGTSAKSKMRPILEHPIRARARGQRTRPRPQLVAASQVDLRQLHGKTIADVRLSLPESKRWPAVFLLNGVQVSFATSFILRAYLIVSCPCPVYLE
jgi:hypothetical protein